MKNKQPSVQLSYQDGYYTVVIEFSKGSSIITDGKTIDKLMTNIDDALKCHFNNKSYDINLQIPFVTFNRFHYNNAIDV